jgi:uncharacterized short protein YbdD (DUF466 family)
MPLETEPVPSEQRAVVSRRADAQWWAVSSVQRALGRTLRVVREIVGAPDYERYLERHAACHPDKPPLAPREYYADFVTRRFGSAGPIRCC